MAKCDHRIRETLRGAGECDIRAEVKLRNGNPNWWCHTHGMAAGGPAGTPLDACPGAWFDPIPDDRRLTLDVSTGEIAIWGDLPPAISFGEVPDEPGKVHVHRRPRAGETKDIDESFDIVTIVHGDESLVIEGTAAVAFSISELSGQVVTPLTCPHCGKVHIDELQFATSPHIKHLCNSCGRNFRDKSPSISNPLADAYEALGLKRPAQPQDVHRPLELQRDDWAAISLFPANAAIVSTMTRPEELGVHVHAWDSSGQMQIDETYSPVTLDGVRIDPGLLQTLAVQVALAHGAPIEAHDCESCGTSIVSPYEGWIRPVTSHTCPKCGASVRTRRRTFFNPLAALIQPK